MPLIYILIIVVLIAAALIVWQKRNSPPKRMSDEEFDALRQKVIADYEALRPQEDGPPNDLKLHLYGIVQQMINECEGEDKDDIISGYCMARMHITSYAYDNKQSDVSQCVQIADAIMTASNDAVNVVDVKGIKANAMRKVAERIKQESVDISLQDI